jgi:hypothetical protein
MAGPPRVVAETPFEFRLAATPAEARTDDG